MQKICSNHLKNSREMAEIILFGINTINGDDVHPYLSFLFDYLIIEDNIT